MLKRVAVLSLLALSARAATAACPSVTFTDQRISTGISVRADVIVGDFNGDGRDDLAAARSILPVQPIPVEANFQIFFSAPDGTLAPVSTVIPGGFAAQASGDFDGDGLDDLVTYETDLIRILYSNGDGAFTTIALPLPGTNSTSILAGDVNGDGIDDLVLVKRPSGGLTVLLGRRARPMVQSGGGFAGASPQSEYLADVDNDHNLDVVSVPSGNPPTVTFGDGTGNFVQRAVASVPPAQPWEVFSALAIVDVDGDQLPDIVARQNFRGVTLIRNMGGRTLQGDGSVVAADSSSLRVLDMNGDGFVDLMQNQLGGFSIAMGNGQGSFAAAQPYTDNDFAGAGVRTAVGDFRGVGSHDVVLTTGSAPLIHVYLNNCVAAATVPTMSPLSLIALAIALACAALFALRTNFS